MRRRRRCPRGRRRRAVGRPSPSREHLDRRGRCARGPAGRHNRRMSTRRAAAPRSSRSCCPEASRPGALEGLGDSAFDDVPVSEQIDVGDLDGDPAIAFRRTLGMFATGVTVLTTRVGDQVHGMTANAFMSVSLQPAARPDLARPPRRMCGDAPRGQPLRGQRARPGPDGAVRLLRPARAARASSRSSSSSATRRSSTARWRTSSRASCARTGAATTRSSSGRSSTRATARASRCSSTAAATSGWSASRELFSRLPRGAARPAALARPRDALRDRRRC